MSMSVTLWGSNMSRCTKYWKNKQEVRKILDEVHAEAQWSSHQIDRGKHRPILMSVYEDLSQEQQHTALSLPFLNTFRPMSDLNDSTVRPEGLPKSGGSGQLPLQSVHYPENITCPFCDKLNGSCVCSELLSFNDSHGSECNPPNLNGSPHTTNALNLPVLEGSDFQDALAEWKASCNIPRASMDKLLFILRAAGHGTYKEARENIHNVELLTDWSDVGVSSARKRKVKPPDRYGPQLRGGEQKHSTLKRNFLKKKQRFEYSPKTSDDFTCESSLPDSTSEESVEEMPQKLIGMKKQQIYSTTFPPHHISKFPQGNDEDMDAASSQSQLNFSSSSADNGVATGAQFSRPSIPESYENGFLLKKILHILVEVRAEVKEQGKNLNAIWTSLASGTQLPQRDFMTRLKDVSLPLSSIEELERLVTSFATKEEERNALVMYLTQFGGNTVKDTAAYSIMRALLLNALAAKYSFQGAKGKKSFKETGLPQIVFQAVCRNQKLGGAIQIKEVNAIVGEWLRYASARMRSGGKKIEEWKPMDDDIKPH